MLPFKGKNRVTQIFSSKHGGIDVVGDDCKTVFAVTKGRVELVQYWDGKTRTGSQSYGNLVRILGDDGVYVYYAHLEQIRVEKGQVINCGDVIGIMGNTGNSFGAHLHLEARTEKKIASRINPQKICSLKNVCGVFEESTEALKKDKSESKAADKAQYKKGDKITLKNAPLYISATAASYVKTKSGEFFVYDGKILNNRMRITCNKLYAGRTPVGRFVTGWIDLADLA